ncbi:MAG: hypothetical protein HY928_01465 [Elusimicrobia bacterium]|nr:hypothetical protein [Elusimicrobiota bacterium]
MGSAALAAAVLFASQAAANDYRGMAAELARAAQKAGVRRIAVMSVEPLGAPDAEGAAVVGERLVGELARQPGIQVVERSLLDRVMKEQRLAQSGAVAAADAGSVGKLMGVDAIVTGSLVRKSSRKVEVNLRLIHAADARVLGASSAEIKPDWPEPSAFVGGAFGGLSVPPPPTLDGDFTPWWEGKPRSRDRRCEGWERRVGDLQSYALPLKVRFWGAQLAQGVERGTLKRNPGSEIRELRTRAEFYLQLRQAVADGVEPLNADEMRALANAESEAEGLVELCDG